MNNILSQHLTETQLEAVTSIDCNVLVSAGAGSGKTHVLVERYLNILLNNPEFMPHNILAITYTTKASEEMRLRIRNRLMAMLETSPGNVRFHELIEDLNNAHIGTIHSLCEKLLKAHPAQTNYDSKVSVTDNITLNKFMDKACNEAISQKIAQNSPSLELFYQFDIDEIIKNIKIYLNKSLELKEIIQSYYDKTALEIFVEFKDKAAKLYLNELRLFSKENHLTDFILELENHGSECKLNEFAKLAIDLIRHLNFLENDPSFLQLVMEQMQNFKPDFRIGKRKCEHNALKEFRNLLKTFNDEFPYPLNINDEASVKYITYFLDFLKLVELNFNTLKQRNSLVEYNDLILFSIQLLDNPQIQAIYHDKIQSILLDEFQDSNLSQLKLIAKLTGVNTKLFFIGDDKQSIYKFQGASVEVFNYIRDIFRNNSLMINQLDAFKLSDKPRKIISLNQNFRSKTDIVEFNNFFFQFLLKANLERNYECEYNHLMSAIKSIDGSSVEVVNLTLNSDLASASENSTSKLLTPDIKENAAYACVFKINEFSISQYLILDKKDQQYRPINYSDIAILITKNSDFQFYEKALQAANIKFLKLSKKGLLNCQEIIDVVNLAKFIDNTTDFFSFVSVLRSPMFNFADDLILQFKIHYENYLNNYLAVSDTDNKLAKPIDFLEFLTDDLFLGILSKADNIKVLRVTKILEQLIFFSKSIGLADFFTKIITLTNFDNILLTQKYGLPKSQNIWKLVAIADKYNKLTLSEFIRNLELFTQYGEDFAPAITYELDQVKLLTIHGSKGLEYPCVILPLFQSESISDNNKILFDEEFGVLFNTAKEANDNEQKCNFFQMVKSLRKKKELAETKRLFYVAMTRARDSLIIINPLKAKANIFHNWFNQYYDFFTEKFKENKNINFSQFAIGQELLPLANSNQPYVAKLGPVDLSLIEGISANLLQPKIPDTYNQKHFLKNTDNLDARVLGNYFHTIMDNLPFNYAYPNANLLVSLASDMASPRSLKYKLLINEGQKLLDLFYQSDLYNLLITSSQIFHELPILDTKLNNSLKIPDLVLQDKDSFWHVIDYKTDKLTSSEIASHVKHHRSQVLHYEALLTNSLNVTFKKHIYFAAIGVLVAFT